jgi:nucleoside-diphosphate kinase
MTDQQHTKDPEIFKHLSPKTQGFLRASANYRNEQARLNDHTMATEQTYVDSGADISELFGGEADVCA